MIFDLHNEADTLTGSALDRPDNPSTLKNAGMLFMRGGVGMARMGALAASPLFPSEDDAEFEQRSALSPEARGGIPSREDFFRFVDERLEPAAQYWKPSAPSLSKAAQIIESLAELPLQLAGGPAGLVASATLNTSADLVNAGVDSGTATAAGILEGAGMAAAVALPVAGKSLKQTLALVGLNPVIGGVQAQAVKSYLESQGNEEQAAWFDPLDPAARSLDLVLGGLFGGMSHYAKIKAKLPVEAVDSIDAVENFKKIRNDNPVTGVADRKSVKVHLDAHAKAVDDVHAGRAVDVSEVLHSQEGTREAGLRAAEQDYHAAREGVRAFVEDGAVASDVELRDLLDRAQGDRPLFRAEVHPEEAAARRVIRQAVAELKAELAELPEVERAGRNGGTGALGDIEAISALAEDARRATVDGLYGEGGRVKNREAFLAVGPDAESLGFVGSLADESGAFVLDAEALGRSSERSLANGEAGSGSVGVDDVGSELFRKATGNGDNVILPLVDPSPAQLRAIQEELRAAGYKVSLRMPEPVLVRPDDLPGRRGGLGVRESADMPADARAGQGVTRPEMAPDSPLPRGGDDGDSLAHEVESLLAEYGELEIVTHYDADRQAVSSKMSEVIGEARGELERFQRVEKAYERAARCLGLG